jgi:hypothetical protein
MVSTLVKQHGMLFYLVDVDLQVNGKDGKVDQFGITLAAWNLLQKHPNMTAQEAEDATVEANANV